VTRISKTGLLVLVGVSVPIIIELRTVLAFFGVELSAAATFAIGVVAIGALVLWARFPPADASGRETGEAREP